MSMKATVSLKQLRTDPREYVRLLNAGYEVSITEHRRVLVSAAQPTANKPRQGDGRAIIELIRSLPKITVLDPDLDTVEAVKKAKHGYLSRKYGYDTNNQ
jgi:antitoxin (DNA-binding transcriptional repressor) of toxin-antitoxin stability system